MPEMADWRRGDGYDPDDALDWPRIAMGYLSRNDRYRQDHAEAAADVAAGRRAAADATRALVAQWGISLAPDDTPDGDPHRSIVPPSASPSTLMVVPVPAESAATPVALPRFASVQDLRPDAWHAVLATTGGDLHLWLPSANVGAAALLLPLDADLDLRLAAAARLLRRLMEKPARHGLGLPSRLQRARHLLMFRVLDGRRAGVRAKELAAVLIDPAVRGYRAADWADCRQRKQITRWLAEAEARRDGGYLALLRQR